MPVRVSEVVGREFCPHIRALFIGRVAKFTRPAPPFQAAPRYGFRAQLSAGGKDPLSPASSKNAVRTEEKSQSGKSLAQVVDAAERAAAELASEGNTAQQSEVQGEGAPGPVQPLSVGTNLVPQSGMTLGTEEAAVAAGNTAPSKKLTLKCSCGLAEHVRCLQGDPESNPKAVKSFKTVNMKPNPKHEALNPKPSNPRVLT